MFATTRFEAAAVLAAAVCALTAGCVPGTQFGCTPGIRVTKNPGDENTGIRYYRPKPYLLLTPATESEIKNDVLATNPSVRFVSIQLDYLPDFSEEYAIEVTPGLGTATVNIGLENGWNLTSIDQTLDSQFDDNVKAISDLVGAVGGLAAKRVEIVDKPTPTECAASTNVPLGYYEAVLGRDHRGCKRLYGWRYVGFVPFAPCPLDGCGSDMLNCQSNAVYGLVFENGVMTFKELYRISPQGCVTMDTTGVTDAFAPPMPATP